MLSSGCGSPSGAPENTTPVEETRVGPSEEELASVREESARQDAELRRLRGQLAMAQAEAELAQEPPALTETVRIGDEEFEHDDLFEDEPSFLQEPDLDVPIAEERAPEESGPRLVLRLHGTSSIPERGEPVSSPRPVPDATPIGLAGLPSAAPPVVFPAPPPGVSMQLPTTTAGVASLPVTASPAPVTTISTSPRIEASTAQYRAALRLVHERQAMAALSALARFVEQNPSHALVDDAIYWQGEVLYMQRRYRSAVEQYELVVSGHRGGNKAADAMLKIGLCLRHMGEAARAATYFERLRSQYPDSVAARMSSREGAS